MAGGTSAAYINLTGGTSIEKALDEMLYDDNVNEIDSDIKTAIDTWYANNMTGYTSYLEDAIWCNDRSTYDLGGWNPNGGSVTRDLFFGGSVDVGDLTCKNKNDRFTVSSANGNGKLTYPVGLATVQEHVLGYSINSPIQNGASFWTLSPALYNSAGLRVGFIYSGSWTEGYVDASNSIRPTISLRMSTGYTSGYGTVTKPFIIATG